MMAMPGNPFDIAMTLEFCENTICGLSKTIVMLLDAAIQCHEKKQKDWDISKTARDLMRDWIVSGGQEHGGYKTKAFTHLTT